MWLGGITCYIIKIFLFPFLILFLVLHSANCPSSKVGRGAVVAVPAPVVVPVVPGPAGHHPRVPEAPPAINRISLDIEISVYV